MRAYIDVADLKQIPDRSLQMTLAKVPTRNQTPGDENENENKMIGNGNGGGDGSRNSSTSSSSSKDSFIRPIGQLLGQMQLQQVASVVLSRLRVHAEESGLRPQHLGFDLAAIVP